MKNIAVIYHADCPDGFGGAFAAWKKFGNEAEYIGKRHGETPVTPSEVAGREVYMIDFSYPKEILLELERASASFTILDHHKGAQEAVESVTNHIFDNDHSGAAIAWKYFHPEIPLPRMLTYIEDNDLWRHSLPESAAVSSYLHTIPMEFDAWEKTIAEFEDDARFADIIETGKHFRIYNAHVIEVLAQNAELVEFEGHTVFAVNAPRLFRSELGNFLAEKHPPFAIVWYEYRRQFRCSLRGVGDVDLSLIAAKYGGNGHRNAASFRIDRKQELPWKRV